MPIVFKNLPYPLRCDTLILVHRQRMVKITDAETRSLSVELGIDKNAFRIGPDIVGELIA
jgi:hypothetical protein